MGIQSSGRKQPPVPLFIGGIGGVFMTHDLSSGYCTAFPAVFIIILIKPMVLNEINEEG